MANSPHSAKMTKATPQRANGPKKWIRNSGSIHSGSSIGVSRAGVTGAKGSVAACENLKRRRSLGTLPELADGLGVGPHPPPWPDDPRLDAELLAAGDRRNVVDRYRYWKLEAIVADLDTRRHPLRIAIQNWEHDFNIGSMVRTANAFNVAGVHILGRRRWNRRGAMVTDRYLHLEHHADSDDFAGVAGRARLRRRRGRQSAGRRAAGAPELPERVCLVFGSEGPGLTPELVAVCERLVAISQYGSTRSLNAGAAAAIAMYHWAQRWALHLEWPRAAEGVEGLVGPRTPSYWSALVLLVDQPTGRWERWVEQDLADGATGGTAPARGWARRRPNGPRFAAFSSS